MISREEALQSWREIRNDVKDTMDTFNGWEEDFNNVLNYINQSITLDSELNPFEKVKKNGIHFKFPIKDSDVEEAKFINYIRNYSITAIHTVKRIGDIPVLSTRLNLIEKALSDKETLTTMYATGVKVNEKLNSKLNAIDEWIISELGENDISSLVPISEDLNPYHCKKLRELQQILKGDNNEKI